jgi:hypothetical protein
MPKILARQRKGKACHVPYLNLLQAMVEVCYGMAPAPNRAGEDGIVSGSKELWVQIKVLPGPAAITAREGILRFGITPMVEVPGAPEFAGVAAAGGDGGSGSGGRMSMNSCGVCPRVEVVAVHTFPVLLRGHGMNKDNGHRCPTWRLTALKDNLKGMFEWRLFAIEAVSERSNMRNMRSTDSGTSDS